MWNVSGRRRVLLNSASATTLSVVQIVIAFIMSPLIVGALGDRVYGVWEVLVSVVGYFGILDAGLGPAVVRYVAVADSKNDRLDLSRIVSTSFAILLTVGLLALILTFILSLTPETILKVSQAESAMVSIALIIIGVHLLIRFPGSVLDAFCLGRQRHYFLYSSMILSTVLSSIGVWYFLTRTDYSGLLIVATFRLLGDVAHRTCVLIYVWLDEARPAIGRAFVSMQKIKELYLFGLKSMLLMVSDRLRRSSMPLVITHVIGIDQVVFYALAEKLVGYAAQFVQVLGFPLTPYFSSLSDEKNEATMRQEWLDMSRFLQFVQFGFAAGAMMLGVPFLAEWMGERYAVRGEWTIYLLSASFLVSGIAVNSPRLLVSLAKHERAVKIMLPTNILAVILAIVLARYVGLDGVSMAILAASFVSTALVLNESCRSINVSPIHYLARTTLPNLVPVLILVAVLQVTIRFFDQMGYLEIVICAAVAASIYLLCGWLLVLKTGERHRLLEAVKLRRKP